MGKRGQLVVQRFRPEDIAPSRRSVEIVHAGKIISVGRAIEAYRGFDGLKLWPQVEAFEGIMLDGALAPASQLSAVLQYASAICRDRCDLLFCDVITDFGSHVVRTSGLPFLGFDYGWLESEYNRFSVVLHEVVFGSLERMREYTTLLNRNLLFDSLSDVVALARERESHKNREGLELESVDRGVRLVAVAVYDLGVARG